ncbi:MAG TPA: tetratricopeptide repeat protein [Clostridiales bacterium]|nr:tetratricopeptide repeat protein [Clostridiales bacterium]
MKMKLIMAMVLGLMITMSAAKGSEEMKKGKLFYSDGKYDLAIEWFEKALEKEKESSVLYLWLAKAYLADMENVNFFTKGMYSSDIRKYLKLSIEKDPKNIEAYNYLASYYFNAPAIGGGDKDEAWKLAEQISKLSPSDGHEIKGRFYSQEKLYDKALAEYDGLIDKDNKNTHAYYLKGILYQEMKDYDKAFGSFEAALSIDPSALESLYQVGRTAVFSGQNLDRGIECLTEYLKHEPDKTLPQHESVYWRLAMIYQLKKDNVKAKEMIGKAIAINPQNEDYKKLLKELN